MNPPRSSRTLMDQWWKLGGAAGILFVVLFIIGIILQGNNLMPDDPAGDIRGYYAAHHDKYLAGDYIIGTAFVFFLLPFASALRSFLGLAEGENGVWSWLVFAGALLTTAVGGATAWTQAALAYSSADFTDDNILKTLNNANYYTFTSIFPLAMALMILFASIVILRTRALWPWLGYFGLVETLVLLLTRFAVFSTDPNGVFGVIGFISFIGLGIWIIAASIGLWLRDAPPVATAAELT